MSYLPVTYSKCSFCTEKNISAAGALKLFTEPFIVSITPLIVVRAELILIK